MAQEIKYNTRHHDAILSYLESIPGKHVTAGDVCRHFSRGKNKMGVATVYRQMERLVQDGLVQKFFVDEKSGACFAYVGNDAGDQSCFHCKCEDCGKLIHLECEEVLHIQEHLLESHSFALDTTRTVFYGRCADCGKRRHA